ncbi:hypothetical protein HPB47_022012 [Ixodes persulcatus]|uniref:Uncharacterized protein n=1 Tax=Ixodes persulcatus TaxID=34615 RepID=A0AC60QAZ5_IXOPE|nr:hypothetical protein HPB47_022012 [Ixodes persulcatus]
MFLHLRARLNLSKLSYFHNPGKEPLLPWTAGDLIDRATDAFGDTTAIVYPHQNISKTYAEYKKDPEEAEVEPNLTYLGNSLGILALIRQTSAKLRLHCLEVRLSSGIFGPKSPNKCQS